MNWEVSNNQRENEVMKRFMLKNREEYTAYEKLARGIREIVKQVKDLDPKCPHRIEMSAAFLEKLYGIGLIENKWNLENCVNVSATRFCRRRITFLLVKLKMAKNMELAQSLVEGGNVRVGPDMVLDPAFLVPRNLEDYVTWVDTSKIRQKVSEYNDMRDDYDAYN